MPNASGCNSSGDDAITDPRRTGLNSVPVAERAGVDDTKGNLAEMTKPSPPRLHVLIARDVPVGVVIRRGPSKVTATFLWDMKKDTFTLGQWVKARIYERRSDLSPDGKHLIYFALDGSWRHDVGTYTAISRAPYLKAISFYVQGDAWNGGGLWIENHKFWLNESRCEPRPVRESPEVMRGDRNHYEQAIGECPQIYVQRLLRDGWHLDGYSHDEGSWKIGHFHKRGPNGWRLDKLFPGRRKKAQPVYVDEHRLVFEETGVELYPDWEWADMDRGRLVWATEGRIETGVPTEKGMVDVRVLHDFNGMTFKAVKAPY